VIASWTPKAKAFWSLLAVLMLADCSTSAWRLSPVAAVHSPRGIGRLVPVHAGVQPWRRDGGRFRPYSRFALSLTALLALALLGTLYRRGAASDAWRAAALALVAGGAAGNLLDRVRSARAWWTSST
jgi:signal peptidase II